jgi:hypothetical protein
VAEPTPPSAHPYSTPDTSLDALVSEWLTLPDVAARTGRDLAAVRRMLRDNLIVAVRRAPRPGATVERCVPADLLLDGHPLEHLPGTLTLLRDAGFSIEEALQWLFTPDDTLPGTPVEAMRAGKRAEVRRRAQALAF